MFKFNFDLDDSDIDNDIDFLKETDRSTVAKYAQKNTEQNQSSKDGQFVELSLEYLLNTLPGQLSYSPLEIPDDSNESHYLSRRDLFDARFQVISEDESASETTTDLTDPRLKFLDTPSDLLPGVYEGGLKTWECSLDLVQYLRGTLDEESLRGKRVLELGCGTGLPSLYLLQTIFSSPPSAERRTVVHLQDYNTSALELVTFPNVLLAWYMSSASASFLSSQMTSDQQDPDTDDGDVPEYPEPDPKSTGDLPITPALKDAFIQSLQNYGVELNVFGGSWKNFKDHIVGSQDSPNESTTRLGEYDVVLTSETIYRMESVPELIDIIWHATHAPSSASYPSEQLSDLSLSEKPISTLNRPLVLVAAKIFYFGVGGGVDEFVGAVKRWNGRKENEVEVKTVWERNVGVGRRIVRVTW